jgi:enoyl-CoA hydratase/carnithine racemase
VSQEDATFCAGQAGALSGGVAWHLHRLGGTKLAARLVLAGQQLSAAQAVGHGIVTESAPADSVRHTVETLLAPLQHGALGGLLVRSHRHAGHLDLDESIDYDIQLGEVAHAGS